VYDELAKLQALSEPVRFRLARIIVSAPDELCICELVDILQLPQYAVSRAATALRRSGILAERRDGKLSFYRAADDPVTHQLLDVVRSVPADEEVLKYDLDRMRWRMDIRESGRCVVMYLTEREPRTVLRRERVLFICVHNSARSQIAEEYLRRLAGDLLDVESAGLTPGTLNPWVVKVMAEDHFDISAKIPRSVFDLYRAGHTYSHVITVCSREAETGCPVFPGPTQRMNWPFPDPSNFTGTPEEILEQVRELRDTIRDRVSEFVAAYRNERETRGHK